MRLQTVVKYLSTAIVFMLLASCSLRPAPVEPGNNDPNLLVSGEVVQVETSHSYTGEPAFTEDAHAIVTLEYVEGFDALGEVLAKQRIEDIDAFPISFRLEGDPKATFNRRGYYLVAATVYMGASDELYIGDFSDNIWNEVDGPTSEMKIRVSGLEQCGTPESGGGCATRERP